MELTAMRVWLIEIHHEELLSLVLPLRAVAR